MRRTNDQHLASFISKKLQDKDISIKEFASSIDASDKAVHMVIRNEYCSAKIRIKLSKLLGYSDWLSLVEESNKEEVPA